MKKAYVILLLLVIAVTFLFGSWYGQRAVKPGSTDGGRKILYYVDPMNPAHTSDRPGPAPCGMPMEPVYADGEGSSREGPPLSPGAVKIGPEKQQLIGVRVSRVEKAPVTHALRLLGWVTPDEERLYKVNAAVDGWIESVAPVTTGSQVENGQLLGTYATADLFVYGQQMLFALQALHHLAPGQEPTMTIDPTNSNFLQRVENLRSRGMSTLQIDEFRRTLEIPTSIKIFAPAAGFVLVRNVSPGEKFEKSAEWFRIADLSQVWVLADVPENEARYLKPGQTVRVTLPQQGREFQAKVSTVLPQFDSVTRTLKVRLQTENPDFVLKPNMYVNVELSVDLDPALSVPMDAMLDTGTKKTVFVDRGDGYFEPREVKTGWRFGDRVEVTEGLTEGERIVVSGNFLIDSESRMKLAAAGFYGEIMKDPVCGMHVDADKAAIAGLKSEHGGKSYYFCSEQCRTEFDKQPERFTEKQAMEEAHDHEAHAVEYRAAHQHESPPDLHEPVQGQSVARGEPVKGFAWDTVCGMPIPVKNSKAEGLTSEYEGKTYYFCSKECKGRFDKSPSNFIHRDEARKTTGDVAGGKEHQP